MTWRVSCTKTPVGPFQSDQKLMRKGELVPTQASANLPSFSLLPAQPQRSRLQRHAAVDQIHIKNNREGETTEFTNHESHNPLYSLAKSEFAGVAHWRHLSSAGDNGMLVAEPLSPNV